MRARALSAEEFCARVIPALADREAENNLPFGIALRLAAGNWNPAGAVLLSVESGAKVVAGAVRTPPHDIVVTRLPAGAARAGAGTCCSLAPPLTPWPAPQHYARELGDPLGAGRWAVRT